MTLLIQIIENTPVTANPQEETLHYVRRVEAVSVQPIIDALDAALKSIKPSRAPRKDKGQTRTTSLRFGDKVKGAA